MKKLILAAVTTVLFGCSFAPSSLPYKGYYTENSCITTVLTVKSTDSRRDDYNLAVDLLNLMEENGYPFEGLEQSKVWAKGVGDICLKDSTTTIREAVNRYAKSLKAGENTNGNED